MVSAKRQKDEGLVAIRDRQAAMALIDRRIEAVIDRKALGRAGLVLAPLVLATALSGETVWPQAALVTISAFIAAERSGLAPLGVVLHGLAIATGFMVLLTSVHQPALFVFLAVAMAAASILLTARGAELRSLGNFTFIPALYLACEIAEQASPEALVFRGLHFLPFIGLAIVPVLLVSILDHLECRRDHITLLRHFSQVVGQTAPRTLVPYREAFIAVAFAVALAAALVERYHIGHGQWVIWSAASVVTGDAASARAKLRDRVLGAVVGVPAGNALGLLLPHNRIVLELTALLAVLTLVGFRRYNVGFGARSACAAMAFIVINQSIFAAGERAANVILGGVVGIVFVLGVHVVFQRLLRCSAIRRMGSIAADGAECVVRLPTSHWATTAED
ncbi:FUSC family protein [Mesorhizobium sp. B2-5-4]|uniref:FUSC family protein n=1 Tax=unclassified Mesorhizobium TaxID=325217 RepID=UPI0011262132|nr:MULTISPECIES: FUSC family protein [unclassified Mesorhizobium]TPJ83295.1 FUSC family protein [Mesorhizobium sp. B2-5-13]TPK38296.1 FUSC family protein [Mesorhizobium sp. B2-5-4]TPK44457.1 FUSC family protein [Mesorhizobium sp. B2-5-5]